MAEALNLLVFRDGRRRVRGLEMKSALLDKLRTLGVASTSDEILGALLRAAELECAVADSGTTPAPCFVSVTDRLAEALVARDSNADLSDFGGFGSMRAELAEAALPEDLYVSAPEGFAYYALHPLAYVEMLASLPALKSHVAVIGVRTIGVTLSAMASAAARARRLAAERITVRPEGHPYNRRTKLSPQQMEFVRGQAAQDAAFLIVDEGPGLSGSTMISAAEALEEAGAPRGRITLVCGRDPDFDSLRTDDGPQRARRFRWLAVSTKPRRPAAAEIFVGGGEWRKHLLSAEAQWPASWTNLERLKYLSSGQNEERRLFKFLGFGHYGERVLARESSVADAGFGPAPRSESDGFASYPWIGGRPMVAEDLSADVIARLAAYCAFRAEAFAQDVSDLRTLEHMADHNAQELELEARSHLVLERPVLADGRMQPHKWLCAPHGRMLKTDSGSHGDDHFFPGITDIAWDLAGAIVEWNMSAGHADAFLEAYRRLSSDDPGPRLAGFTTAYAVFRWAYCRMAADAVAQGEERTRLEQAAARYQIRLSYGPSQTLLLASR